MTIMVGSIIALVVIIILIVAGFIVWRRKSEAQANSLHKIEKQLEEIEVELKAENNKTPINKADNPDCRLPLEPLGCNQKIDETEPLEVTAPEEFDGNINIATILKMKTTDLQNNNSDKKEEVSASTYNMGKSGKIYTAEELDLLIKE